MRCGCEDGDKCTGSTVCAVESAVEDATENMQQVVDDAVAYVEAIMEAHHIPVPKDHVATKLRDLSRAVSEYQELDL